MELRIEILTLYRYFGFAAHMRDLYRRAVTRESLKTITDMKELMLFFWTAPGMYLQYSYSGIYVVIEGWKELMLADPKIEILLSSTYVDRLRRFRNATFHYQPDVLSIKHLEFFGTGNDTTEVWLDELYKELERFFRENTVQMPNDLKEILKDTPEGGEIQAMKDYWNSPAYQEEVKRSATNGESERPPEVLQVARTVHSLISGQPVDSRTRSG